MKKELYLSLRTRLSFQHRPLSLALYLFTDMALIAGIVALFLQTGPIAYLAAIPIAILMIRNVSQMHEAVHGLAHPNTHINYFLGLVSGSLCLLPFHLWKKIHLEHHFWAGNFNRDPSLEIMKRYPHASTVQRFLLSFSWKTRIPLTAFAQYLVFWAHSAVGLIKNYRDPLLWLNMLTPLGIWALILSNLHGQQMAVFAAGIGVYLALFEFINFPHHVGLYLEDSQTARLPAWQQYEVTRTSRYPTWIEKFLVLNFNYHAEHHMFPDLPWHELPKVHAMIQASEVQPNTTVIQGAWLRNKRKDPFVAFLRPDVHAKQAPREEQESVDVKKAA